MANNMPYLQFYPADWSADTRILSLAARGAWLELIIAMHVRGRTSKISGTVKRIAGLVGCSEEEFEEVLKELEEQGVADVSRECNGDVTITCRRLKKEKNERDQIRERVKKHRSENTVTKTSRECNGDVTPYISEPEYIEKENPLKGVKEKENSHSLLSYPSSVEDVLKIASSPQCGLPCTREQADAYFCDRVRKDWIPNGMRNQIKISAIPADLKTWLVRDKNKEMARRNEKGGNHAGNYRSFTNDPNAFDQTLDGSNF